MGVDEAMGVVETGSACCTHTPPPLPLRSHVFVYCADKSCFRVNYFYVSSGITR